jgi:predicted Fe-Mo cluster-binding NifX family protein
MRVAVASSDGENVDQHFGHAQRFLIYEVADPDTQLLEVRENAPACSEDRDGPDDPMLRTVELIADCAVVLVVRAGPCAAELLLAQGIRWIETSASITEGLRRAAVTRPARRLPLRSGAYA